MQLYKRKAPCVESYNPKSSLKQDSNIRSVIAFPSLYILNNESVKIASSFI